MAFSKLNTKPRPIEVLEQIISALETGEYAPGEKLPPERDLATAMGVSRTSIREALSILHTVGVVERQQGSGTYVKCVDSSAFERAWLVLEGSETPHEIFEWQQIIEPAIAILAAQRAKESDLEAMEAALEAMRKALLNGDRPSYSKNDRRFHMAIAETCSNTIVRRQMAALSELMSRQVWRSIKNYGVDPLREEGYLLRSLQFHERVFDAISNADQAEIERAFEEHYQYVREVVFNGKEGPQ